MGRLMALSPQARREALADVVRRASAAFEDELCDDVEYSDSVVGLSHTLRRDLPRRIAEAVSGGGDLDALWSEALDPLVSIQDDDLEMSLIATRAFHCATNLLRLARGEARDEPGLVNIIAAQALEVLARDVPGGADVACRVVRDAWLARLAVAAPEAE